MKPKKCLYIFLLGSIFWYCQPSFALAKLGHKIVCQLAFEHLPFVQQQRLSQLLNVIPEKQKILINHYNHLKQDAPLTFANACTWPDAIKKNKQTEFSQYTAWHYLNVPRNLTSINKPICTNNCLPQAIITHQKQLKANAISWKSAQALLFLGHWLGDIHQPLHVSYASDLGGNKVNLIKTKGSCTNLHGYWDSCLIKQAKRSKQQWLTLLNAQWHKHDTAPYQEKQVWQWANESYQLVRQPSFQYCHLTDNQTCLTLMFKTPLAKNYHQRYLPVMTLQLLKAAQRLTKVLEQSL